MAALAAVLAGAALLVDTAAEAAFDAPKRLVTILGIVIAAAALLLVRAPGREPGRSWARASRAQRLVVVLAAVAVAGTLLSAVVSSRRGVALDAARLALLLALLVPLGASRALGAGRALVLGGVFVGAAAIDALVSMLQYSGPVSLFRVQRVGGRLDVSAFVGNDGVLALALALAGIVAGGGVLLARSRPGRLAWGGALVIVLGGLAVDRSLTAMIALGAGGAVLIGLARGRRALALAALIAAVLAGAAALHPGLAARARETVSAVRDGDWDRALTYRLGPWAAALEMARARPLTGTGPGTFAAEFVEHRLRAELRHGRRLVNPWLAGSYTEAHSEYLQALAEIGGAGALPLVAAAGVLVVGLARVARGEDGAGSRREATVLLAVLCAGAAAAATWFPFQRPVTAVPLLLAAGRALSLLGDRS
jgi:O-antigen ligase